VIDGENRRTTVDGGDGFTYAYGVYQGRRWQRNANGIVTVRSNFAEEGDPADHATVLGLTQTQPQDYVVDVNPPGGVDEHLYYNAKTFLLDRDVQFARDRYQHIADYSDYRAFFGGMEAGRVHYYDGRPQNDVVDTLDSCQPATTVPDLRVPDSTPLFALDGTAPVVLPAQFTKEAGIIIQVKIGDRGYDFLLDSGASGLTIDPAFAQELGLKSLPSARQTIGGGDVDVSFVRVPQMSIGPLQMHNVAFDAVPFSIQARGFHVVGLIGFDFLASAITEIDFKAKTLTLYPRSIFPAYAQGMHAYPIDLNDGRPRVKASFEDVPGKFMIDTGDFMTLTYNDYVHKLPSTPRDPYASDIETVGGPIDVVVLHLADFVFGDMQFRSVDVMQPTGSTFDSPGYDGIIGRDALSAYKVTFDYADNILFLRDNI
jgi:predicted aspartyl protease